MQPERKYFMDYQIEWLKDESRIKIWEKSRRIGATYVQSYEDVLDCLNGKVKTVWFSSADESAAKEYILYCAMWADVFNAAAEDLGEIVISKKNDVKALAIQFANKSRIHALTSNPKAFRSKGGKVILDEFAHHEDQKEMWKAARPSATWGYPIRILSTHNGKGQFWRFIDQIQKGKLNWSLHTVDIYKAVEDGLVDRIMKRPTSKEEREAWLTQERRDAFDETTWLEEYCCKAQDDSDSFLDYETIGKCSEETVLWNGIPFTDVWNGKNIREEAHESSSWVLDLLEDFRQWFYSQPVSGDLYLGLDIGRRKDLTTIWVDEKIGQMKLSRCVIIMENMRFWVQEKVLYSILEHPRLQRACIDETGIGMQLAERAEEKFGEAKVEKINFSAGTIRSEMAFLLKRELEDVTTIIPRRDDIRDDFHSIKKIVTAANNIRLAADSSEDVSGHADRFWGKALCLHASTNELGPVVVVSRKRRRVISEIDKY